MLLDGVKVDAGSKNCFSPTGVLVTSTDEFSEYKLSHSSANSESVAFFRTLLSSLRVGSSVVFFVVGISDIIVDKQAVGAPG